MTVFDITWLCVWVFFLIRFGLWPIWNNAMMRLVRQQNKLIILPNSEIRFPDIRWWAKASLFGMIFSPIHYFRWTGKQFIAYYQKKYPIKAEGLTEEEFHAL